MREGAPFYRVKGLQSSHIAGQRRRGAGKQKRASLDRSARKERKNLGSQDPMDDWGKKARKKLQGVRFHKDATQEWPRVEKGRGKKSVEGQPLGEKAESSTVSGCVSKRRERAIDAQGKKERIKKGKKKSM